MRPLPRLSDDQQTVLRYTRPGQWPFLARNPVLPAAETRLLADSLGCTAADVGAAHHEQRETVRRAAAEELTDAGTRRLVEHLPLGDGDRVVAVGDSVTADRLGWFEMLSAALSLAGPIPVATENLALSGSTTADAIERFDLLEAARPTRVLLMLGTNDARSHGRRTDHTMISPDETRRNLLALLDMVRADLGAEVTVLTPPAALQGRIDRFFRELPLRWRAADIAEVADTVRRVDPDALDVHAAMAGEQLGDLLESDGIHPSVAGQRVIFRTVLRGLATQPSRTARAGGGHLS
ncbi:SGNH/GDSL hydrolase family protein [Nakamurella endophytica]|uniref:SGNH hydrolase-type esterase domain-containing protein n=1 Tax=Nakamurella endophytica TaxID=1748367 RepID=A0A917WDB8_9ACTN|nr:SGNH/GDSL hydrolase family protein [Nakamurella endophytica]GGL92236.1 hypothetical protein GCM10011594_09990 [Nakamurella endophytica]